MAGEGGTQVLLLLSIFGGLLHYSVSTSCGPLTDNTCVENDRSLGVCSVSVCECKPGYAPHSYGCQDDPPFQSGVTIQFNGDVEIGSTFYLYCSVVIPWEITWSKNGANIQGATNKMLTVSGAQEADSGAYRCQHNLGTQYSLASEPAMVTVGDFTSKPIVIGLSEKVAMGMTVNLRCENCGKSQDLRIMWKVGETEFFTDSSEHDLTHEDGMQGISVACGRVITSDPIALPAQFSDTIPDVEVVGLNLQHNTLDLLCQFTDNYPSYDKSQMTVYSWYRDGIQINWATSARLNPQFATPEQDSGSYQCAADYNGRGQKLSPSFKVEIVDHMIGNVKCVKSGTKLLKNGYLSMTVEYKTKDKAIQVSSYEWSVSHRVQAGMTGPTLEINSPGDDQLNGDYRVTLNTDVEGVYSFGSCGQITAADTAAIETSTPRMYEKNGATTALVDVEYTFVCESDYHTPGGVYTWYEAGDEKMSSIVQEYQYKATHNQVLITCDYRFDGSKSPPVGMTIKGVYIGKVIVTSDEGPWQTEPFSVDSEFMGISCIATLSPSVTTDVTYSWQHDNISPDEMESKCTATVLEESKTNSLVLKRNAAQPIVPKVTSKKQDGSDDITNEDAIIAVLGEEVTLYCLSQSYQSSKSIFKWKKGEVVMESETGFSKRISSMKKEDEGQYTCQIVVNEKESEYSVPKMVTFTDAPPCTWTTDCELPNYDDTICMGGKCQCLDGYKIRGRQCVTPCDRGWRLTAQKDTCVRVIRKKKSFERARDYCMKTLKGDLITSVTSSGQRSFVTRMAKNWRQFWIGVHSPNQNGDFQYVNQEPVVGRGPFKRGRPTSNSKNYCVTMKKRVWFDKNCRRWLPFACEKAAN